MILIEGEIYGIHEVKNSIFLRCQFFPNTLRTKIKSKSKSHKDFLVNINKLIPKCAGQGRKIKSNQSNFKKDPSWRNQTM